MTRLKRLFSGPGWGFMGCCSFCCSPSTNYLQTSCSGKALTLWTETQTLVSAETVSFALPLSYALERVSCEASWPQGVSKDHIETLTFGPEWSRIFYGALPLKGEANLARGRVEARMGVPLFSRGYLDAKGFAIHLEELSFLEILLDRRVSGQAEGELRLLGDVRSPVSLNGRGFLRATDGAVESKLPLAGLRTISFPVYKRLLDHSKRSTVS